jgi:hypothetical protein
MQGEGIVEHTKWQVSYVYILLRKRKLLLRIPTASVIRFRLSMQEENILEHINAKCHLYTFLVSL